MEPTPAVANRLDNPPDLSTGPLFDQADTADAAVRLQDQLKWASPPNVAASAALFALGGYYGSGMALGLGVLTLINAAMSLSAYRYAQRQMVTAAVLAQFATLWAIGLLLALGGVELHAVVVLVAILPNITAAPYLRASVILRMCQISVGIVLVGLMAEIIGPPLTIDPISTDALRVFAAVGCTVLAGLVGMSVYQTRLYLDEALARVDGINQTLLESERSLDKKVIERTAELDTAREQVAEARDEAVRMSEMQEAFLSNVSHELRTPLNAIIGFSEVLGDGLFGELNEKQAEYVDDIHQSGHHLLSLINDILDLTQVETGEMQLSLSTFDVRPVVANTITLMKERAGRRGVNLETELDAAVTRLTADERKLKQVLINLLSNAVKFTPEGGSVTLAVRGSKDAVHFAVTDTGIGISAEDQAIIFDDFRQATSDHMNKSEGTGLGLGLARRMINLHSDTIKVSSQLGEGTTMSFDIRGDLNPDCQSA